jgi:2-desacetyl-2-hydroxyethyl bacteriochlorophyllide A dehydrogenase
MDMKAAVLTDWKCIEMRDVPIPELGPEECLIKVQYAGICGSDLHIYEGHHPTARKPLIPGHEFVGTIESIRTDREIGLAPGDRVVVEPLISCRKCEACREGNWHVCRKLGLLGIHTSGGFAEYVKAPVDKTILVNPNLPDKLAALTEPFAVGFHVTSRAGVRNGDRVLIIGGGPIGLIAGIVARECGASLVAFSEINEARIGRIRELGFEHAMNPAKEDVAARTAEWTGDEGFDIVIEVSGSQPGLLLATQACRIRGTVVLVGFPGQVPQMNVLQGIFKELTIVGSRVYTFEDFRKTVRLLERMAAERRYDLELLISGTCPLEGLEAALKSMKDGTALGKIMIAF